MIMTQTEADFILENLDDAQLNDWEQTFVQSLRLHRKSLRPLTNKQIETLSRIWDRQS